MIEYQLRVKNKATYILYGCCNMHMYLLEIHTFITMMFGLLWCLKNHSGSN